MLGLGLALKVGKRLLGNAIDALFSVLKSRSTYYENATSSKTIVKDIDNAGILDDATILLTPTSYSDARVHSVKTYTGDELITNGTFDTDSDWTLDTGWTIVDGKASYDNSGSVTIKQSFNWEVGKTYEIQFEVSDFTSNYRFDLYTGRSFIQSAIITDKTTWKIYFVGDGGVYMRFRGLATSAFSIDNVSVKDVSSDFDFDRASSATRINSSGLVQDMQSITDVELVQNGDFEELGDEEITNGTFDTDSDWTKGAGWSIANGVASSDGTQVGISSLYQSVLSQGVNYKIQLTISDYVSGSVGVFGLTKQNQNGTFTYYYTPSSADSNLYINADADFIGSIDNISVKQVDPNNRWTLGTGWSIEDGKASCNGSSTNLNQNGVLVVGRDYKITITVTDYVSGTVEVSAGAAPRGAMSANGTYTFYQNATPTTNFYIVSQSFNGSVDNISVKDITFSTDVDLARINYDSNGENGHWLLEPTSTNLITYSEDFSEWDFGNFTTQNYATAPDGSMTASLLDTSSGTGTNYIRKDVNKSNSATHSVWVKAAPSESATHIRITNNNQLAWNTGTSKKVALTTEWQRIDVTDGISGNAYFLIGSVREDSTTDADCQGKSLIWGAQLEALPYATSYIPTYGSTVTRAAETLTGSGNSTLINSTEGVLYAEIASLNNTVNSNYISLSDSTYNNRAAILYSTGSNIIRAFLRFNGNVQADMQYLVTDITDYHKVAFKYKANDFALWIDGVEVATDTSGSTLSANTLNALSFSEINTSANAFKGKCKALAVFDRALTDQELTDLTS